MGGETHTPRGCLPLDTGAHHCAWGRNGTLEITEFFCDAAHSEGLLQCHVVSAPRKRCREENQEIDADPRHMPPHMRVQVAWENATSLVTLRGRVLDADGRFNAAEYPGLVFFYNPVVTCVASGTVTLHFDNSASVTERILQGGRQPPCPVHGPFRCPCHLMHEVADGVAMLLSEIFCQHAPFDVSIDCDRPYPHIHIDSQAKTWSLSLVGLPVPPKVFGPFPLGTSTSPQSIKKYWFQYIEKSKALADACIMCGTVPAARCAKCLCLLCQRCGEHCGACGSYFCHGCSTAESGMTLCYNCHR
ncbi:hypothetical protein LSCM4_07335 [Leishmania orientalis]|uniref:Uncharacterized protein n=1 Tax=Leishmania orientalis TaxID=2249476 RepID=A0A836HHN8_9TRYP|nr:hypothetical protein LSCM4_07335 [Leishmania orientalis]